MRKLNNEINRRYGTRKDGGRPPRWAEDENDFLCQLEKMCESWRCIHQQPEDFRQEIMKKLPEELRNSIDENSENLFQLQEAINTRLQEKQKERQKRSPFRHDNKSA